MELRAIEEFLGWPPGSMTQLKKDDFAYRVIELVAAAEKQEREACAKIADAHTVDDTLVGIGIAKSCADMIRARTP